MLEIDNRDCKLAINSIVYAIIFQTQIQDNRGYSKTFNDQIFIKKLGVKIHSGELRIGLDAIPLELDFTGFANNILNIHTTTGKLVQCKFYVHIRPQMDGFCMVCCNQPKYDSYFPILPDINIYAQPAVFEPPLNWSPSLLEDARFLYNEDFEVNREQDNQDKLERVRSKGILETEIKTKT